jgi:outer membrane lipoprotein carrier protein
MFINSIFHRKDAKSAKGRKESKSFHLLPAVASSFSFANFAPLRLFGEVFVCLSICLAAQTAQAGAIDKLHRFLETTKTLRADFAQIVVAKNGKKPQQSAGQMMISRPGKFRWQITKPYAQLLVGDGEKVWIYDEDLRQVSVKKFDAALGSTPAALLVGNNALDKNFTLREAGEHDGLEWLEAIPKGSDSGFEKLQLGFAGNDLKAMELSDNFGQTTSLLFARIERNVQLAPSLFHFTPPAGVDVIGE